MATVPTALTAVAGTRLSAATFNAGVRDVLNWELNDHPRCHVTQATLQALPNNAATYTLIAWDGETYDTDSMHDTVTQNSRIKFPTAGLYEVNAQVSLPSATYTALDLRTNLNAGGAAGTGILRTQSFDNGAPTAGPFVFHRFFTAGDYIEFFVAQASGAIRNTSTTTLGTRVFARWIASS